MIKDIFETLRIKQWSKNIFVFAGVIFSQNLLNFQFLLKSIVAFLVFCLLSSATYIFNDLMDIERDSEHPEKKKRPMASGRLKPILARFLMFAIVIASLFISFFYLNSNFAWVAVAYLLLQLFYTGIFKHLVILDVFAIAIGFVLRSVAGAVVIEVEFSSWLLICTVLLALFLGFGKRRHELTLLGENASLHRPVLGKYNCYLLDQLISVVTASTVMAYALYTVSEETVAKFHTRNLIYTIPFVLYGVFRYLYLIHKEGRGGAPENILISDIPFIINILLWISSVLLILYLVAK